MWSGAVLFVEKSVVPKKCLFLIPIPKPLSRERLCMLGGLCVLAKPLGVHARHPCRG